MKSFVVALIFLLPFIADGAPDPIPAPIPIPTVFPTIIPTPIPSCKLFYCKGVMSILPNDQFMRVETHYNPFDQTSTMVKIYFKKSKVPAGDDGEHLKAGECGWENEGMEESDPSILYDTNYDDLDLTIIHTRNGFSESIGVYHRYILLTEHMEYVIPLCVYRSANGLLKVKSVIN